MWRRAGGPGQLATFRELIATTHAGDTWVSDGNFAQATFDLRLPRADAILWLEAPRPVCAWRAVVRTIRPGEAHRANQLPKVLAFIRRFDRVNRPLIEALRLEHGPTVPVIKLRSRAMIDSFLRDRSAASQPRVPHASS